MTRARALARMLALVVVLAFVPQAAWSQTPALTSQYIEMRDGVRIAVDVWTPPDVGAEGAPTVLLLTRYWRSRVVASPAPEADVNFERARLFAKAGYALAIVDVRGSGASFGSRVTEFSPDEIRDYGEIIAWIAAQPWSNGRVATTGSSYLGNTAELAAIHGGDALRAAVPRFSDFDTYRYAVFPGGVPNTVLLKAWGEIVGALDRDDPCVAAGPDCDPRTVSPGGVKPVQGSEGQLAAAVAEHAANLDVTGLVDRLVFIDDSASRDGDPAITFSTVSPSLLANQIDKAAVPMEFWAGWFDAGTADGALSRFMTYKTPMRLIIGPWNHGATQTVDPYARSATTGVQPTVAEQYEQIFAFLKPYMIEGQRQPLAPEIRYYTLGAGTWRTTRQWPPAGVVQRALYAADHGALVPAPPSGEAGGDTYRVDFSTSSGPANRWTTQLGGPVDYGDRASSAASRLNYTSPPLARPLEITGQPVVELWLTSSTPDGALHVYLEDVAPDGRVSYLTEGEFRLIHRKPSPTPEPFRQFGPSHSFRREDAEPMPADRAQLVAFNMMPISVVIAQGHRVRLSIAGADAAAFARIPATGPAPVYDVRRGGDAASRLLLPTAGPIILTATPPSSASVTP
ncbi:MAG TPA: CocE/NonD family hydrolase [Caulobacter sp.]|nr:CocE/NonD family hydrolase [Caulobacter sp.]